MKTWLRGHNVTEDDVRAAFDAWMKSRAGRKHGDEVYKIHGSPEELIKEIHHEIEGRALTFHRIRYFMRREKTNGKLRKIGVQSIKQQVCDYLVVMTLQPFLDAKLGYYQCASVPGKGQVFAKRHIEKWYREGGYFIKMDVRKCFPSVDQDILMAYLRKSIGSADLLYVIERSLANYPEGGLNIGSYLSQYLANLVLSRVYHHIEDLHKIRREKRRPLVTHQLWYMDDLVMFACSKRDLAVAAREVERFINVELRMHVKPWKVCKCGYDALDMVGFVIDDAGTRLRPQLYLRSRRAFTRMRRKPGVQRARRCVSYWGFLRHSDCGLLRQEFRETFDKSKRVVSAWEKRHQCNASAQHGLTASKSTCAMTESPSASFTATSESSPIPKGTQLSFPIT